MDQDEDVENGSRDADDGLAGVLCPTCFEEFGVAKLPLVECPAQLDYDCEVCCRPMILSYDREGFPQALGMDEAF